MDDPEDMDAGDGSTAGGYAVAGASPGAAHADDDVDQKRNGGAGSPAAVADVGHVEPAEDVEAADQATAESTGSSQSWEAVPVPGGPTEMARVARTTSRQQTVATPERELRTRMRRRRREHGWVTSTSKRTRAVDTVDGGSPMTDEAQRGGRPQRKMRCQTEQGAEAMSLATEYTCQPTA